LLAETHSPARIARLLGDAAKERGVYKGRAPKLDADSVDELKQRVANGESKTALAKEYGISRETVYQHLRRPRTNNTKADI
jgi:DNA invertase Pin-like site-specific DNA recombinase